MKQWTRFRFQAARIPPRIVSSGGKKHQDHLTASLGLLDRSETADKNTFASLLRQCGSRQALDQGRRIHRHIVNTGLERDIFLQNLLVQMYGNCGSTASARCVFDSIAEPNSVSWHLLMLAYAQGGDLAEVRAIFHRMPEIRKNSISWNIIVTAFAQTGYLDDAKALFQEMPRRDVVSWNTIITALVRAGRAAEAIALFRRMDVPPDHITFVSCIDACASALAVELGKDLHSRAATACLAADVLVATSLVSMYGKFGSTASAKEVYDSVSSGGDVILHTSMIAAFAENGEIDRARELFHGLSSARDHVCWTSMIVACGSNGELPEAERFFQRMPGRSLVSWNAMMGAMIQSAEYSLAIEVFREMDVEGVTADKISCVTVLDACANLTRLDEGRTVHWIVQGVEELGECAIVKTALLNLYGKCGKLAEAREIFDEMAARKTIETWNAMISSYAQKGQGRRVLELYWLLNLDGIVPDFVTFLCVISTCSHAGLVEDGRSHFHSITADFSSFPTRDHYCCMLDLLGRAGRLNDAEELVELMPFEPNAVEWTAVLGGCETHGEFQRGERVSKRFFGLKDDETGVAPYLLLSNQLMTATMV
ncbi:pentatricopeptide repeat-containing protein At4g02750-like [Selaginella moellendorffii]|uniref:pentatricopeptide repeat-containing protein At4g02750-like n=1 Tax=Selaginella moellendorffii TaxID=88036 RepID=UPI000D1C2766|nr:pentatricopeptide repeat-containing protein At4g02750-like [Selaginella moellendorffii]|eukprot:XP_024518414.1 pentatricopeptide repeat-containing protein At4g02750-like [Selaginella moellendorffii]